MTQFEKYPGENPLAAQKRIAKNKARKAKNPAKIKTKGDLMAENIMPTIKNMGYQGVTSPLRGLRPYRGTSNSKGKVKVIRVYGYAEEIGKKFKKQS